MIDVKYYEQMMPAFVECIQQERDTYLDINDVIVGYIKRFAIRTSAADMKDDRIIIGGNAAALMILKEEQEIDDHKYLLYSEAAVMHAFALTNELNEHVRENESRIVYMSTKTMHIHFEIRVDNRLFVDLFYISSGFANANVVDLINPSIVDDMLIISPEFHLADYYKKLYSPEYATEWEELLVQERRLFTHAKNHMADLANKKTTKEGENKLRAKVELEIMIKFVKNNNKVVLIGEYALRLMLPSVGTSYIIKLISENDFAEDYNEIKRIISEMDRSINVEYKVDIVNVIGEYDLRRMAIKFTKDNSYECVYIYNSATYELIPFNPFLNKDDFLQVGSPFLILRFLLLDVWLIRRLIVGDKINKTFGENKIAVLLGYVTDLRIKISTGSSSKIDEKYYNTGSGGIFQRSNYIGKYSNKIIKDKIKNLKKGLFVPDYLPQAHLIKFGVYKTIQPKSKKTAEKQ